MTVRPTLAITVTSPLTAAVTGEGAPVALRKAGCRWQTAPRKPDGWLIPRSAIAQVVSAARALGGAVRVMDPLGVLDDPAAQLPFNNEVDR